MGPVTVEATGVEVGCNLGQKGQGIGVSLGGLDALALLVHVTFGGGRGVGSVSFESVFSQAREIGEPGGLNGIADSRGDR